MTARRRSVLRSALGLLLLGGLVVVFNPIAIIGRLSSVDLGRALPAIAGLVAMHLIAALSWRRLADRVGGVRIDAWTAVRLYYAAQAWGAITPANVGADVYRVTALDPAGGRGGLAAAVVVQRLTSVGALLLLGGIGAVVVPIAEVRTFVGSLVVLCGVIGVVLVLVARRPISPGGAVGRAIERLGLRRTTGSRPGVATSIARDGFGLALVFHGLSIGLAAVLVTAVDSAAAGTIVPVLGAIAIARLSLAVPISPNGIGLQEGALSVLFVQLGLSPEVALAASLLNRAALVATAGLGWIALTLTSRASSETGARESASSPAKG
jgi:uncharacterized membrane protein YbhN (UPF0104 family)